MRGKSVSDFPIAADSLPTLRSPPANRRQAMTCNDNKDYQTAALPWQSPEVDARFSVASKMRCGFKSSGFSRGARPSLVQIHSSQSEKFNSRPVASTSI